MSDPPGFLKGLAGPILEPVYLLFGDTYACYECEVTWRGYYVQHMNYCHFCGEELMKYE